MSRFSTLSNPGRSRQDDQDFNDANNGLSRAMGRPELFPRGLTDGAASKRGAAGKATRVPIQPVAPPPPGWDYALLNY